MTASPPPRPRPADPPRDGPPGPARRPAGRAAERPRDALGRPLPAGAAGAVPSVELPGPLPPPAALAAAQHLLDAGRPFHAHEVLEAAWRSADDEDRALWRALTQLAVGITHLARGGRTGGIAVLSRAAEGLAPYAEHPPHGVDVPGLRRWIERRIAEVAGPGDPDSPVPPTPAPRLLG